ncbi:hypothetical protein GCM10023257_35790 [Streptomyces hyderabadensis]|uniref:Uncharacterized protein n=1 Tax=Streptomyces hyderabadensis TaxID=598549 RepID=A0ABP9I8X6_9ACTN
MLGPRVLGLHLVRHVRTLTAPHNAEDPVAGRRQGLVRNGSRAGGGAGRGAGRYAAVEPAAELPEPEEDAEDVEDEPESEEDEEAEDEAAFEDDDAGELLDELPRLSLR